jgi:hypothetical protein
MKYILCLLAALAISGCSSDPATSFSSSEDELAVCPAKQNAIAQEVATLAFTLMTKASIAGCGQVILAPQMYKLADNGIVFDEKSPFYANVTDEMKGLLALVQEKAEVKEFLANGLKYNKSNNFAKLSNNLVAQLAGKVTLQPWCNSALATFDTKDQAITIASWSGHHDKSIPWTPFNGDLKDGNPFLFVSKAGLQLSWNKLLTKKCAGVECGVVEMDPTPYSVSDSYYNQYGLVGTQQNPFIYETSTVFAAPYHKDAWATRWILGIQEWGQFSIQVGTPAFAYKYIKRY